MLYPSCQFSPVQFKMVSVRTAKPIIMRTTLPIRSFPNVDFETIPVIVRLTMKKKDVLDAHLHKRSSRASFFVPSLLSPPSCQLRQSSLDHNDNILFHVLAISPDWSHIAHYKAKNQNRVKANFRLTAHVHTHARTECTVW